MNNRAITLSALMAALAVFFVQSYVSSIEDQARKKFGTEVSVVVAKRDISEMETVNETMLELKLIPKDFLEPAAISFEQAQEKEYTVQGMKDLAGTVAIVPIRKGEQITYNKLTEPNMRTGLSPQVTPGRRAIAVPVNEVTGVAKLVKPGDRVDLIAVMESNTGRESRVSKTILQDVVVLAVGRHVTNNVPRVVELDPTTKKTRVRSLLQYDGFTSVTLEVEPGQAQALALIVADTRNILSLSLRNNDDTDRAALGGTSLEEVLGPDAARYRTPARGSDRR